MAPSRRVVSVGVCLLSQESSHITQHHATANKTVCDLRLHKHVCVQYGYQRLRVSRGKMSSRRPTTAPATGAAAAPLKPVSFAFDLSGLSKTLSQQQADTGVRSGRETLPESIERELGELDRSYATVTAYGRIGNRDYQKRSGLAIMTDKAENLRKMINKYAQADSAGAAEYRRRLSDSIRNLRTLFNEVYDRDQKRELREEYDILFTFDRDDAARRDDRRLPSLERQRSRDFSREREAAAALDSDSDSQDDTPLAYRRLPVRAPEPAPAPAGACSAERSRLPQRLGGALSTSAGRRRGW